MKIPKEKAFREYLVNSERAANTIDVYLRSIRCFFSNYSALNKPNLTDWKDKMITKEGVSHKTANTRICGMNVYLDFLNKPELKIKQYKIQRKFVVDNVISLRQYQKLLTGLKRDNKMKWYFIIKTLGMTGVRAAEILQFKIDDFEKEYVPVFNKGKSRKVYIPHVLCQEVLDYYSDKPEVIWLCEKTHSHSQMSTRGLQQMMMNFAEEYDIDKKVMHAHAFRHMFAINFLKNNRDKDLVLLANMLGHSSINTTAIYLQKTEEEQIKDFNKTVCW